MTTPEIIAKSNLKWNQMADNIDAILDLATDDIKLILRKTGKPIVANFYELYSAAAEYTKKSIKIFFWSI